MTPTPEQLLAFYEAGEPFGIALDWLEERHPSPVPALLTAYAGDPPGHLLKGLAAEEWLRDLLWRWLARAEPRRELPPDVLIVPAGTSAPLRWRWEAVRVCDPGAAEEAVEAARAAVVRLCLETLARTTPAEYAALSRRLTGSPRRALKRAVLALFPEVTRRRQWTLPREALLGMSDGQRVLWLDDWLREKVARGEAGPGGSVEVVECLYGAARHRGWVVTQAIAAPDWIAPGPTTYVVPDPQLLIARPDRLPLS